MKIPIDSIKLDSDLQPRAALNQETINEYTEAMKAGAQFPGVVIFQDGEVNWLADGYHRYAAAKNAGAQDISAEIRTGSKEDALKFALSANATHGLRRSQADKRRAVVIALKRFGNLSNRELGRLTAVDDKTVGKYRERLAFAETICNRLEAGESLMANLDGDKDKTLFMFRIPDHPRFEGRKYLKYIYVDASDGGPGTVRWDTRGRNVDTMREIGVGLYMELEDHRILELTDFSNWKDG
jgi:uncharacterized ParB-like nuclease family protein